MGAPINTPNNEGCPTVSLDNEFFFYFNVDLNGETPRGSTYWVDIKAVGFTLSASSINGKINQAK